MSTAYARIPPDRPATLEELALSYGPVAEYQARQYYREDGDHRRSLDDLRQDAWEGILLAWHRYDGSRGASFKSYAISYAWWTILNNLRYVDSSLFNSKIYDKGAYVKLLQTDSLDRMVEDLGEHLGILRVEPPCHEVPSMDTLLALLDDSRLRFVVDQYYRHGRILEDIGNELGITRERVRQLLEKAYPMMRRRMERGKRTIIG